MVMATQDLITTSQLATRMGKDRRWVQRAVARGDLKPTKVTTGPGGRKKYMFDERDAGRQLAQTMPDKVDGLLEKTKVFILGLVRGNTPMAEAIWLVINNDMGPAEAARIVGESAHAVKRQVERYRGDIEAFIAAQVGLDVKTEPVGGDDD